MKSRKTRQEALRTASLCYSAPKNREAAPFERTRDFKRRIHDEKLASALKSRDKRLRQLQKRGY